MGVSGVSGPLFVGSEICRGSSYGAQHPWRVPRVSGDPSVLLISVHGKNRWPFTGGLTYDGGGNALNLPALARYPLIA